MGLLGALMGIQAHTLSAVLEKAKHNTLGGFNYPHNGCAGASVQRL